MKKATQAVKNSFIPHEGNGYMPHMLRPRMIAFMVMVVLVAEAAFVFGAKYVIPSSKLFGIVEANVLIDETNQSRTTNGLPELQVNPLLTAAAQDKANDMATKGYFAHTSPQGLTPWYWFEQVGYNFDYAGENLAVNFSDSQDVTDAWMNSPEHRANILSTDFTQIGIATAQGVYEGQETTFVVEEFGTPAAAPVAFVNTANAATAPVVVPAPVPATSTSAAQTAPAQAAPAKATTPAKAKTPAPVASVPAVVAIQSSSAPAAQQTFVAVEGASTETVSAAAPVPATTPIVVTSSAQPVAAPVADTAAVPVPQSSLIQRLFSNPKTMADDFYFFVMILFFVALVLNIFVNIRLQYPRLIAGGLLVIVVAGLCIMLNQNIGFLHVTVI
ncbi:MAG TPA: CAP domain-containing protein [Candidatus Paceibacterota bacterium]|nr:CAP domain-containing protein [Candidatus Paceibacterota bacterium]